MKAILMVTGMGARIATKTNEPECLLDTGNESLICHTVELLLGNHMEVCICLDFKEYLIREALHNYPVTFYGNLSYRITNNIISLRSSREQLDETQNLLLANASVFWQQDIPDLLLANQRGIVLPADSFRGLSGGYLLYRGNRIPTDYGKDVSEAERTSEYAGIARTRKQEIACFRKQLKLPIHKGDCQLWWENTLYSMISQKQIPVQDIVGHYRSETDILQDYENILDYVHQHPQCPQSTRLMRR